MGEQRGKAPLLTVDLTSVTVELISRDGGLLPLCTWTCNSEIYTYCTLSQNQLEEDKMSDQISIKEFIDPFTGSKNSKA